MDSNISGITQKLMEAFLQFSRLNWYQSPIVGLRSSELLVLYYIKRNAASGAPGFKISEISNILNVTSPTITQQINSLEAKGFVERDNDKEDRRVVRIKLTDKGEIVAKKALDIFFASFNGLVEYLGEENSSELAEFLSKVFVYFNEMQKQNF